MATYNISSYNDLKLVVSGGHLADDLVLTNNIDCSDSEFENWNAVREVYEGFDPIGQSGSEFTGTFDGGGFTISNLHINWIDRWVGLFGAITKNLSPDEGFFKDVKILNADVTAGASNIASIFAGSLTGYSSGTHTPIDDIEVQGTVDCTGSAAGGGMFGQVTRSDITNCLSNANCSGEYYFGGFAAYVDDCDVVSCTATGSISHAAIAATYVGGFVGSCSSSPTFELCKSTISIASTTTVSNPYPGIGGFVGQGNGAFEKCYATGVMSLSLDGGRVLAGGFTGDGGGGYTECYANTEIICPEVNGSFAANSNIGGFSGGGGGCTDCYSRGDVCADGVKNTSTVSRELFIGGFIGAGNATRCYSTGKVGEDIPGSGPTISPGGFTGVGSVSGYADCFWDTETSNQSVGAGTGVQDGITGKTTDEMKTESTFTNYDFTNIWNIPTFTQPAVPQSNLTVWLSKKGDYHNFDEGIDDDDSFSLVLPTTNEIRWIKGLEALVVGTSAGEWKIASNKLDTPLSPTAYSAKRQTTHGSKRINAIPVNSSLLFVDFVGRKLREVTFNPGEDKYVAPDMTELAEHITKSGIVDVAHQKNPDSILWCVLGNGNLLGFVYDRDQDVFAWSEHTTDGTFQSVSVVPGTDEDIVWVTVARDNGTTIERFAPRDFGDDIADAFFVDGGITDTSGSTTISGLTHLQGQDVVVLGDGEVQEEGTPGDFTVTVGGEITVPSGLTKVQVGLPYDYKLQPMRIVLSSPNGTSFGSTTRVHELVISFLNTLGAQYGSADDDLKTINFDEPRWEKEEYITGLFSGDIVVSMPGGLSVNNPIFVGGNDPLPCTVRLMIARFDKTGR